MLPWQKLNTELHKQHSLKKLALLSRRRGTTFSRRKTGDVLLQTMAVGAVCVNKKSKPNPTMCDRLQCGYHICCWTTHLHARIASHVSTCRLIAQAGLNPPLFYILWTVIDIWIHTFTSVPNVLAVSMAPTKSQCSLMQQLTWAFSTTFLV